MVQLLENTIKRRPLVGGRFPAFEKNLLQRGRTVGPERKSVAGLNFANDLEES